MQANLKPARVVKTAKIELTDIILFPHGHGDHERHRRGLV